MIFGNLAQGRLVHRFRDVVQEVRLHRNQRHQNQQLSQASQIRDAAETGLVPIPLRAVRRAVI
jgi:hypothetical protein